MVGAAVLLVFVPIAGAVGALIKAEAVHMARSIAAAHR
jgi:hypothetical protein